MELRTRAEKGLQVITLSYGLRTPPAIWTWIAWQASQNEQMGQVSSVSLLPSEFAGRILLVELYLGFQTSVK